MCNPLSGELVITGRNFADATAVSVDGQSLGSISSASDTELRVALAPLVLDGGSHEILVTNGVGTNGGSDADLVVGGAPPRNPLGQPQLQ